ncbi:probable ubiquitin carboxyl-terminal hydrolase MINDY-4 [Amia ocellicauda]|uniref:probable ubiquitin carboxyl-terminal hydrolase MINDY-4 n=1 Tax=Amia ocellicauda TaxID=2972642 RepID=UPI0034639EBD
MNNSVEEVAASLVREYLSRKGLKKTMTSMDQELPRTDTSISNRSDLRRILHLESLYKKNKTQEAPLKALLEVIVKHHMEENTGINANISRGTEQCAFLLQQQDIVPKSKSTASSSVSMCDVSDEEKGGSTAVSDWSKTDVYRAAEEAILPSHKLLSPQTSQSRSTKPPRRILSRSSSSEGERDGNTVPSYVDNENRFGVSLEKKNAFAEIQKNKSNRILRGMMSGPIASSQQENNKKRPLRRPSGSNLIPQLRNEEPKNDCTSYLSEAAQMTVQSNLNAAVGDPLSSVFSEREPGKRHRTQDQHRPRLQADPTDMRGLQQLDNVGKELRNTDRGEVQWKDKFPKKMSASSPKVEDMPLKAMKLDDINDEEDFCEVTSVPILSRASQLNVDSHPIDLRLACDLKELLFGSSLNCFNEEWKVQSFTFSDIPQLKYGIVQKKGGPCGVLASVQACVLQKLLFEDTRSSSETQKLQPSNISRTRCLVSAVAEILWRAGEQKRAIVALSFRRRHFIPAGRYKADGILETITLNTLNNLDDLKLFLEHNIHQFELGPSGCILLVISAILSRSMELVRLDFDVPSNTLIGAHGYCTQELVNLLLTGRAVSNVFNDDIELDSGNGNITLLKGVKGRSDIGLLSLFEHYNVCKVGSYLKTPKYPIWVICSESHFSVLFCTRKELMNDWRIERRFDLYYYDGLANQQEEIRLTIVTSQNCSPDVDNDLVPPLEHCIRTKWKGAMVDWNDSEPIL